MKKALYAIFSQFGSIVDIVVMKTFRLRGQAWVAFEDLAMAANAMRSLHGFDLFDKEMVRETHSLITITQQPSLPNLPRRH